MKYRRLSLVSLSGLALFASLAWLTSCSKSADTATSAAPTVPAAGISPTAAAIASHLESGGEFYAVVDVKGEIARMGDMTADFVGYLIQNAGLLGGNSGPASKLDYRALVKKLGLYNVDGFGLSSWEGSDGLHHNRSFLYTPNGRTGLLKIFGDKPGPFVTPNLAPADADFVGEGTLDLKSLEELIVSYAQDIGGPAAVQQYTDALKQSIPGTTLTGQSLIDRLNTRVICIIRTDPKQIFQINPTVKMPMTDFLISLDGFADVLDQLAPLLKDNPMVAIADKNGMKTVTIEFPIPDPYSAYKPMLISDPKTKRLYLVSRESFANETIFGQGARLASSEDFKAATTGQPTEGNWLGYLSKKGASAFVEYYQKQSLAQLPPTLRDSYVSLTGLDKIPHGVATIQVNLPDGILTQSLSNRSPKDVVLLLPLAAVAIGGMAASEAIPAYSAARGTPMSSPGGSSSDVAIRNNLRKIANASTQYILDKGVTEVRFPDLISGPTPYLSNITSVAGENYSNLVIRQSTTRISVTTADGRIISYDL